MGRTAAGGRRKLAAPSGGFPFAFKSLRPFGGRPGAAAGFPFLL